MFSKSEWSQTGENEIENQKRHILTHARVMKSYIHYIYTHTHTACICYLSTSFAYIQNKYYAYWNNVMTWITNTYKSKKYIVIHIETGHNNAHKIHVKYLHFICSQTYFTIAIYFCLNVLILLVKWECVFVIIKKIKTHNAHWLK